MVISLQDFSYGFKTIELIFFRFDALVFLPNGPGGGILIYPCDGRNRPHVIRNNILFKENINFLILLILFYYLLMN